MDTLGRAIIWSFDTAYGATYPLRYIFKFSTYLLKVSIYVACYTWNYLWEFDARRRQRLYHTSRVAHNTNVSFCHLPEDALLLIFDFVESSGRFGERVIDFVQRLDGNSLNARPVYLCTSLPCLVCTSDASALATRVIAHTKGLRSVHRIHKDPLIRRRNTSSGPVVRRAKVTDY